MGRYVRTFILQKKFGLEFKLYIIKVTKANLSTVLEDGEAGRFDGKAVLSAFPPDHNHCCSIFVQN